MLDVEFTVSIIHCYLFNIFLLFCLAHLAIVPVQFRAHPLIVGARESLNGRGKKGAKKNKEQGSSPRSLLFFAPFFSACLDFSSPLLSAPGSPRMFRAIFIDKFSKVQKRGCRRDGPF